MTNYNSKVASLHCGICSKPKVTIYGHSYQPVICPRCDVTETKHNGTILIQGPPVFIRYMRGELL